jgi:Family of unknown function (DUF6266)
MARMYQGILGGLSGKIGNVIGSSWKGIPVLKTKPLSVANPQTTAQVAQRTAMTACTFYASLLNSGVIKPLWDRFASKMSGYNAFVQANVDKFTSKLVADWADIVTSKGKMVAVAMEDADALSGDTGLTATFPSSLPDAYSASSDKVYLCAINSSTGDVAVPGAASVRADGAGYAVFRNNLAVGNVIKIYLAFKRVDGTIVSDSSYKTYTVPS